MFVFIIQKVAFIIKVFLLKKIQINKQNKNYHFFLFLNLIKRFLYKKMNKFQLTQFITLIISFLFSITGLILFRNGQINYSIEIF